MGMTMQQNIARMERRHFLFIEVVSVGGKNHMSTLISMRIMGQNRELQHHLIDFTVTVAPDTAASPSTDSAGQ